MDNLKTVVLEDGSSFIKVVTVDQCFSFPSRVIRKALPSSSLQGFSTVSYEIEEGVNFSVSEMGEDAITTDNRSYQTSLHNRVLIHHGLKLAGITDEAVNIVVTLPVGQFFNADSSLNTKLIEAKIANAKGTIKYLDGTQTVRINECSVLPEAVPGFVYAKEELNLKGNLFLFVDIGGTTTDLVVISKDDQIEKFVSLEIGLLGMLRTFKTLVSELHVMGGITDAIAIDGIMTGIVGTRDVSSIAKSVVDKFQTLVNEKVEQMGELRLYDAVIFSGGGANLLVSEYVDVLKTKEPQFDNARGAMIICGG